MKKSLFILIAALVAFCACQKAVLPVTEGAKTYDLSQLRFDLTIEMPEATKGVRQAWQNGDKVYIFFQNVSTAYAYVEYDGSAWSADPVIPSPMSTPSLGTSGYLTAVYLPYGNNLAPTWDGNANAWVFSDTDPIYYYYLKSENAAYFITDSENVLPTLGAYLYMDTADRFVQFFIPDDSASGTIQLACNELIPAGIAGVSLDGTVTETTGSQGGWVTARADTIDGEEGYYASGKLSPRPGSLCYFAIDAGAGAGAERYKHYFKQRNSALSNHGAYQLPAAADWLTVSSSTFVEVNNYSWCSVNYGASTPWETGTFIASSELNNISEANAEVPSDVVWDLLLDRTKVTWSQASILDLDGYIIMDRTAPSNFFFLPNYASGSGVNYWSSSSTSTTQHYMKTDNEGTHEISDSDSPASAQVRLISTLYGGAFNPPVNGGDI